MNTAQQLHAVGQSVWYDNVERRLLNNGELAGMIARGRFAGSPPIPTIFMNAVTKSNDYDAGLTPLAKAGKTGEEIFWDLAIEDIQAAADLLRPLYDESNKGDGYVSLEVNPYLAHDTTVTLSEAKRLWKRVNRPNLMVKIPATLEGLPAIKDAIEAGINVNVTLIFSRERYAAVMEAYISGLENRAAKGLPIDSIASVASFFVSRVDTKVDGYLNGMIDRGGARSEKAAKFLGQAAIANARLAYNDFKIIFGSERFAKLKALGAPRAASAVGLHRHQEPGVPRRGLHRRAGRRGYGQHRPACDPKGVPGSWHRARQQPGRESAGGLSSPGQAGGVGDLGGRCDART